MPGDIKALKPGDRIGGKGTPRFKRPVRKNIPPSDKVLFKNTSNFHEVEASEVNMFTTTGEVIHFKNPKGNLINGTDIWKWLIYVTLFFSLVTANISANSFVIGGKPEHTDISKLMPDILYQLGPDSLDALKKIAKNYTSESKETEQSNEEEDIPELVEDFEQASLKDIPNQEKETEEKLG
jgi:nascent polypeptide-associated complex subunit beta